MKAINPSVDVCGGYVSPESVTSKWMQGVTICFSKIAGAPTGSPQFLGSKEESMVCALRRYEVTDSGIN
ncbi:MAG: hypothetical protein P8X74_17925 [Reinekea sp.]